MPATMPVSAIKTLTIEHPDHTVTTASLATVIASHAEAGLDPDKVLATIGLLCETDYALRGVDMLGGRIIRIHDQPNLLLQISEHRFFKDNAA